MFGKMFGGETTQKMLLSQLKSHMRENDIPLITIGYDPKTDECKLEVHDQPMIIMSETDFNNLIKEPDANQSSQPE